MNEKPPESDNQWSTNRKAGDIISSEKTLPASGRLNVLAAGGPVLAVVAYFVFGEALWAIAALALFAGTGLISPEWKRATGLARVLLAFCLFTFAINQLGIAYPYSNIFVLTGLLGLFFFTGQEWQGLYFQRGQAGKWMRPAVALGAGLAVIILALHQWRPEWTGSNPVPRDWPVDVLLVLGLGYAAFSAVTEETIFRSILVAFGRPQLRAPVAVVAQGIVFGAMHYRAGFPSGFAGALLALFWGLVAGWLVLKADSIFPAYVMHFVVVLVLFMGLAFSP